MESCHSGVDSRFMLGSVKTYSKAVQLMRQTFENVTGERLDVGSRQPRAAFEEALRQFESKLSAANAGDRRLLEETLSGHAAKDPMTKEFLEAALTAPHGKLHEFLDRDMDLVPPRLCLETMQSVALSSIVNDEVTTLTLQSYLVKVMKDLALEMGWAPALRVGNNRHFPRIWQWVCEFSESTWIDGGYGLRVKNTSGPVPEWPDGPAQLRVRIDPDRL